MFAQYPDVIVDVDMAGVAEGDEESTGGYIQLNTDDDNSSSSIDRLDTGGVSGENCLACDEFAAWWYAVQRNTIARHNLHLWSWDPGPGHGLFCYRDRHGHVPG